MIRYDDIVPEPPAEQEEYILDAMTILDEVAAFIAQHVSATQAQTDAMTLYAAATHALSAFPAFGRLLLTSEQEGTGKTLAMMIIASLSANPLDASGTSYALQSALAAASNTPEQPAPTLYLDEISDVFGRSGLNASRNPVAEILRKGYRTGATRAWSVNRTSEIYSIYTPFIICGLRVAVPRDIRSRSIVIAMAPGQPRKYFTERESRKWAEKIAETLGSAVKSHLGEDDPRSIGAFRARGMHRKLEGRRLEVWEPLFAVAWALGGQDWLNRCMRAFMELALSESDQVSLSPRQEVIRDAADALDKTQIILPDGTLFASGLALADELFRLGNPLYAGRTQLSLAMLIAESLPLKSKQVRLGKDRIMGYFADDIRRVWDMIRPEDPADTDIPEEENPFDVKDLSGL